MSSPLNPVDNNHIIASYGLNSMPNNRNLKARTLDDPDGKCFVDHEDRDLPKQLEIPNNQPSSIEWCRNSCTELGYLYAGVQYSYQCFCGNDFGKHGEKPQSECNRDCWDKSHPKNKCGGDYRNNVYKTELLDDSHVTANHDFNSTIEESTRVNNETNPFLKTHPRETNHSTNGNFLTSQNSVNFQFTGKKNITTGFKVKWFAEREDVLIHQKECEDQVFQSKNFTDDNFTNRISGAVGLAGGNCYIRVLVPKDRQVRFIAKEVEIREGCLRFAIAEDVVRSECKQTMFLENVERGNTFVVRSDTVKVFTDGFVGKFEYDFVAV